MAVSKYAPVKIGDQFGSLLVINEGERQRTSNNTYKTWICKCKCGSEIAVRDCALKNRDKVRCGSCNPTNIERFMSFVSKNEKTGCWIFNGSRSQHGYGFFVADRKKLQAHRFSYRHFKGQIPPEMFVCHKCDTPPCVNPEHLFIGTRADNMMDARNKGRWVLLGRSGDASPSAKLTNEQVINIRREHQIDGARCCDLARKYGRTETCIRLILKGKTWRHLPLRPSFADVNLSRLARQGPSFLPL